MNIQEADVLKYLVENTYTNQRMLAEATGHSLGIVNQSLKELEENGYIDENMSLTQKAHQEFSVKAPSKAIIMAAGFGMRMVPINMETPKALLEVNGEPLIERLIKQLHEVGITDIYVVIGFMKEKFEYLIDQYDVKLVVNKEYISKNNIYSLNLVNEHISNAYVVPCDIWCDKNPFSRYELYSWYMISDKEDQESSIRVNRKLELVAVSENHKGNSMIGISYLEGDISEVVRKRIAHMCSDKHYDTLFWEEALYDRNRMIISAKVVPSKQVVEINTYEQLRELDGNSSQLKTDAIEVISKVFDISPTEITNITVLKKGMTNRSFLFTYGTKKYIMRIPGEGTEQLINRKEEADVYNTISKVNICDNLVYMNADNGYKITEYMENARVCDPYNEQDINLCMKRLREYHNLGLIVEHEFDIFKQIDFYESLWGGKPSVYKDYIDTKKNVLSLKKYIDEHDIEKILTHIDAVPDNFLFYTNEKGEEEIRLIDWEYAGMQDPHVDIAMFCVYSMYERKYVDNLIDIYFQNECTKETRIKIYCYIAVCGLLWSNWCEYKLSLGVEFGEYSLRQYRYAKEYYKIVKESLEYNGGYINA